jgi:hypothetical protein
MRTINIYKSWPVVILCAVMLTACDRTGTGNNPNELNELVPTTKDSNHHKTHYRVTTRTAVASAVHANHSAA